MHPHLNLFRHAVGTVSNERDRGEKKTTGLQSVISVPLVHLLLRCGRIIRETATISRENAVPRLEPAKTVTVWENSN